MWDVATPYPLLLSLVRNGVPTFYHLWQFVETGPLFLGCVIARNLHVSINRSVCVPPLAVMVPSCMDFVVAKVIMDDGKCWSLTNTIVNAISLTVICLFYLISASTSAQWSTAHEVEGQSQHSSSLRIFIPCWTCIHLSVPCSVHHIALTFSYKIEMF